MKHARHLTGPLGQDQEFGLFLRDRGLISTETLFEARALHAQSSVSIDKILISEGSITADQMINALSLYLGAPKADLYKSPPDPTLCDLIDLKLCLNHSVLAWRRQGEKVIIVASRIEDFTRALSSLDRSDLKPQLALATTSDIQAALAALHRKALTQAASARVPVEESCRSWGKAGVGRLMAVCGVIAALMLLTHAYPVVIFGLLAFWAAFTLLVSAGIKLAAYIARMSDPPAPPLTQLGLTDTLPKVSVLVPLFKESEIAETLIARVSRLTYPKPLLEVVLVLEENDRLTKATVADCDLPPWVRVVEAPEGQPKTKPRAMNYALDFCDGDIIGIWDAEDAPAPDQITQMVQTFRDVPDDVVCLQGVLDYYNPRQNWLARCFTIEYAAWFRLMLPGMSRLGFGIPLGGTTLFFRRDILEELGGWDAHNVTEDADLGFRLARHGYRTQVISTTTGEEANCRLWPWIRQRSRWLKGYMATYLVHMRRPIQFHRQIGAWRFWGFQAHFISALSQFTLAPFLWSFWLVLLGLPHPLDTVLNRELMVGVGLLFLMVEVLGILVNATAVSGVKHRHLLAWVPTMHFYYPLGTIAAYKALYELIFHTFYWDKTQHGHSLTPAGKATK